MPPPTDGKREQAMAEFSLPANSKIKPKGKVHKAAAEASRTKTRR